MTTNRIAVKEITVVGGFAQPVEILPGESSIPTAPIQGAGGGQAIKLVRISNYTCFIAYIDGTSPSLNYQRKVLQPWQEDVFEYWGNQGNIEITFPIENTVFTSFGNMAVVAEQSDNERAYPGVYPAPLTGEVFIAAGGVKIVNDCTDPVVVGGCADATPIPITVVGGLTPVVIDVNYDGGATFGINALVPNSFNVAVGGTVTFTDDGAVLPGGTGTVAAVLGVPVLGISPISSFAKTTP